MKPAWALAVFPLSMMASAADPPYGTAWYEMDHAKCEVKITADGLAADPLLNVSGTKVEFGIHAASVVREQPYTLEHPSNPWMTAKVESWSLTIGPPASPRG